MGRASKRVSGNCSKLIYGLKMRAKKMRKKVLPILFFISGYGSNCQPISTARICITPLFGKEPFLLEQNYTYGKGDSLGFETLKFYLSNLQLRKNENIVFSEKNSYHLIDVSMKESMFISLQIPSNLLYDEIKFNLGIDSITNVSGAMGGDLDPTKGMYWTWQSGYINFKLEGSCSSCPTRNKTFQFHLGGYQAPFNSMQTVILKINKKDTADIFFDLQKYFSVIDLKNVNKIMSPNKRAVDLSEAIAKCFFTR